MGFFRLYEHEPTRVQKLNSLEFRVGTTEATLFSVMPVAVSDFKNGIYSLLGQAEDITALWYRPPDWNGWWMDFQPEIHVVPGVGLTITADSSVQIGPGATSRLMEVVGMPGPFTVVMEFECSSEDGTLTRPGVAIDYMTSHTWAVGMDLYTNIAPYPDELVLEAFGGGYIATTPITIGEKHKVALLINSSQMSMSLDGGAVITPVGAMPDLSTVNFFGPTVYITEADPSTNATATLTKLAFYGPGVTVDMLPELSALTTGGGGTSAILEIDGGDATNTGTPYVSIDGGSA